MKLRSQFVFGILFLAIQLCMPGNSIANDLGNAPLDSARKFLVTTHDKYHMTFDVYTDQDAGGNHFSPSGWMTQAGYDPHDQLIVKSDWLREPHSGSTCIKITHTFSTGHASWAGIYWLYPDNNWGTVQNAGYDLTGADSIVFYARADNQTDSAVVEFFALGVSGPYGDSSPRIPPLFQGYQNLDTTWRRYSIDVRGADLSYCIGGFAFTVTASLNQNRDITFYLDNIQYVLGDSSRQERLKEPHLLLSYAASLDTMDYAEDVAIRNAAFTDDNAIGMLAFMVDTTALQSEDWNRAKLLGDAFVTAQDSDRFYNDGRLRNGNQAGDLLDRFTGKARIPGWWDPNSNQFLENISAAGSSTGSMAWVIIAWLYYNKYKPEMAFLNSAIKLGNWIRARYDSISGSGGYRGGFEGFDGNQIEIQWKSVEHNTLVYTAFMMLGNVTGDNTWLNWAQDARGWVENQWNQQMGRFPDPFTNIHALAYLFLGNYYVPGLAWVENNTLVNPCPAGDPLSGFDFDDDQDGVYFQATAQMALAFEKNGDTTKANLYLAKIEEAQLLGRNGNGLGIIESCHDSVTTGLIDPYGNPIFKRNRLHTGSTSWYIIAKFKNFITAVNPSPGLRFPGSYSLDPNYPNPFNPGTTIRYRLPKSSNIRLTIYNMLGQRIRTLVDTRQSAGIYEVNWDGTNDSNNRVASGIYFYRLVTESFVEARKMILMR